MLATKIETTSHTYQQQVAAQCCKKKFKKKKNLQHNILNINKWRLKNAKISTKQVVRISQYERCELS